MDQRITLQSLVCNDLKYCCLYAFFSLYADRPGQIALRLGLSRVAVHKHKRRFLAGEYVCEKRENCLCRRLPQIS